MGVVAGLYMYVVVVQKFTFAISSPDEFLVFFLFNALLEDQVGVQAFCTSALATEHDLLATQILKRAYCEYVRPLLEFSSQMWSPHYKLSLIHI